MSDETRCADCNAPDGRPHASHCKQRLAGEDKVGGVVAQPTSLVPIAMSSAGLQLSSFQDALEFAKELVKSGAAPAKMAAGAVVGVIQAGAELGTKPMQSLANFAAINGRIGPMTKLAKSLIKQAQILKEGTKIEEWIEVDGEVVQILPTDFKERETIAYCKSHRFDEEEPNVTLFSWADAKRANLSEKGGPWQEYPQRQLMHRARGFHFDDHFGDVLLGMTLAEALPDYPDEREAAEREITPERPAIPESTETEDTVRDDDQVKGGSAAKAILGDLGTDELGEPEIIEPNGGEGETFTDDDAQAPDPADDLPPEGDATPPTEDPGSGPELGEGEENADARFVPPECYHCKQPIEGVLKKWRANDYHPGCTPPALRKAKAEEEAPEPAPTPEAAPPEEGFGEEEGEPRITAEQVKALRAAIATRAADFVREPAAEASISAQIINKANLTLVKEGKFPIAVLEELPVRFETKANWFIPNAKFVKLEDING